MKRRPLCRASSVFGSSRSYAKFPVSLAERERSTGTHNIGLPSRLPFGQSQTKMYLIFWVGFVLFVVRKIWKLAWNVVAAKNTGLPYILTPALETEIIGQILDPLLRRVYRKSLVQGHGWPRWCRYMIREWAWEDRRQTHERLGELFIVVSPEGIICYSCDSVCNADVTSRRLEFVKPQDKYSASYPSCPIPN